jgi:hypothetical protein
MAQPVGAMPLDVRRCIARLQVLATWAELSPAGVGFIMVFIPGVQ